ncbi:histidine kinase [Reichenbachiella agarivorans]|uniref:Histidine kinase n=1 Tax=Reichenbachiella agarivorans TaxID=2979464 RepID=A0ABY6CQC3_9BACT|nr:histidine kinase [Reichenbachiella agarivorans]UXP32724.1 histidine kinase [Reichenbachiella agarivorans]
MKYKIPAILIVVMTIFSGIQASEDRLKLDSLLVIVKNLPEDSCLTQFIDISDLYVELIRSDSAEYYAHKAVVLSERIGQKQAFAYRKLAYAQSKVGKMEESRFMLYKARNIAVQDKDTVELGWIYSQLGTVHLMGQYDSAIFYCLKAQKLKPEEGLLRLNLRTLALAYMRTGNLEKAIKLQQELVDTYEDSITSQAQVNHLNNLAGFYYYAHNLDSAAAIFRKLMQYHDERNQMGKKLLMSTNLASIYYAKGDYAEAVALNKAALDYVNQEGLDKSEFVSCYSNVGINYSRMGRYDLATVYLDSAEYWAKRFLAESSLELCYREKYKMDSVRGDYKSMAMNLKKLMNFTDSVRNAKNDKQIADMQIQYETEKKDQEILNLNQQAELQSLTISQRNTQFGAVVIGLLLLIAVGVTLTQRRSFKLRQEAGAVEQRFLRSQLNPHFIFNSMTAIQQYLLENDAEQAGYFMGTFSTLMRQILENSRREFITLTEEVDMLTNYMELQKMRFQDKFNYHIEIDERLDEDYVGVPPMFAQPFIENSLEHGLFRKGEEINEVTVRFGYISKQLVGLEISDTGIGISDVQNKESHNSLATQITRERLAVMQVAMKDEIGLKSQNIINASGDIGGFRISLTLPTKLITT